MTRTSSCSRFATIGRARSRRSCRRRPTSNPIPASSSGTSCSTRAEGRLGLFGFGKSAPHTDAALGVLNRRRGRWEGRIAVARHGEVPLLVAGGRAAPDAAAMMLGRELAARYPALRGAVAQALWEHYEPYRDAGEAPRVDGPAHVWEHVTLVRVLIEPVGGVNTVELAYRADWDEEHMLGARLQGWSLVELNGSVI